MLTRLEIAQLRNIEHAVVTPSPHINCLIGRNGCGKTSVLEAIHLLGRARSFKTTRASEMIRFEQVEGSVAGRIDDGAGGSVPVGIRLARRRREIHIRGETVQSSAELLCILPLLLIHPLSASLVEGAPKVRRQFLDWGVFHVEHSYLGTWRRYAKALGQRNAALRWGAQLEPWDQEVARYGTMIAEARALYLERLQPSLAEAVSYFLPGVEVRLSYTPGWPGERRLLDVLREDREADLRSGFTQSGSHKGDFALMVNGRPARSFLSRGQSKMMAYALLLAQARFLAEADAPACVMVDDLASELDSDNRRRLMGYLSSLRCQCFITAVHHQELGVARAGDAAVFHVEHGRVVQE